MQKDEALLEMNILSKRDLEGVLASVRDDLYDSLPIGVHVKIKVEIPGPGNVEAVWEAQLEEPNGWFRRWQQRVGIWFLKKSKRT